MPNGRGGHPKNIVFLTADAFGVLPPVAKLTREQAMYYFLSGYTAKVAGTERGVKEPQATFSSCFGAVFLVWHPWKYAEMLGRLIDQHGCGRVAREHGLDGRRVRRRVKRMKLSHTREMVNALVRGDLANAKTDVDPVFGLATPTDIPGVPKSVLRPRDTWKRRVRLRRAGEEACRDVPGELQEVRELRERGGSNGRAESLALRADGSFQHKLFIVELRNYRKQH